MNEGLLAGDPQAAAWEDGWWAGALPCPSPNVDARPPGVAIELAVIHAISLPPGEFGGPEIVDLFLNRLDSRAHPYFAGLAGLRVSAHFLIRRDGALIQFASVWQRAWHAGVSCWEGRERCNDFSLGIELEGCDAQPFTAAQYAALNRLLAALQTHLPLRALAGHQHIAPGRKTDPGRCFEWDAVRAPGLARPA